jgi:pimeloyl-ACP methyl ester carboxylesterase
VKTFGGTQFWGDASFFHGWRIQQNVFTGHYRLLDPCNHRHAFGSFDTCRAALEAVKTARGLRPMSGKAVVVVHGITRSPRTFRLMRPVLENAGFTVVGFNYPSTRVPLADSAAYLNRVVDSLEGIDEIHFVVHSLGGLVTRTYLRNQRDPRIKRMVMVGVPNRGAEMADFLRKNYAFRLVMGQAGQQLVTDPSGVIFQLPIPDFEFAVIAGSRGTKRGFNPLFSGDDDLIVAVESAKLPGAADCLTVRGLHSFLPGNREVIEATLRFLTTGCLHPNGERQPIPHSLTDSSFWC